MGNHANAETSLNGSEINGYNATLNFKELFIRFTVSAFRKLPSIYVFSYFPFGL